MKPIFKYALIFIAAIAVLAGISAGVALIYRNEILSKLLTSFAQSQHVNFEAKETNFVITSNIKNTKFIFEDVSITSKNDVAFNSNFLMKTGHLGVEVDLFNFLLFKELKIEKIEVVGGSLQILPLAQADKPEKNSEVESWLRKLARLSVENFTIYAAQGKNKQTTTEIEFADIQTAANSSSVGIKIRSRLQSTFFSDKQLTSIYLDANGVLENGIFTLGKSRAAVDGLGFAASGELGLQPFGLCKLWLNAKNMNVEKILPTIRRYATLNELENAEGRLSTAINIYGNFAKKGALKLSAQGDFLNGNVQLKNQPKVSIQKLNYLFKSENITNEKSYSCQINDASISYQEFKLSGSAQMTNFDAPTYEANITFVGDVKTLKIESLAGGKMAGSAKVKARGLKMNEVEKLDVLMDFSQLQARVQNENYIVDGEVFASKNQFSPKVSIKSKIVNGSFEGKIENYLPYLLDSKKPCEMKITGNLSANLLDLDKLFLIKGSEGSTLSIRAEIDAQAKEMRLFKENCLNSSAKVYYDNSFIAINQLKTKMYGGAIAGDLKIFTPKIGSKRLSIDLYFSEIEINKLNFLNEDFNVKKDAIQGLCNGSISLNSTFDSKGLSFQNAKGTTNFTIKNGRLYKFEPIQALSGYVKKSLLEDVKFSALRNTISMDKGTITIPRMEVRSSALNTYISGNQQINGDFDYHITLFVSELLRQKNRNIENPICDDKTKLFLRFTSKNGKRNVGLDSEEWSNNFSKKIQREAAEIRAESGKASNTPAAANDKIKLDWEEETLEEKTPETPKKEERKKPSEKQKSEVKIEWDEL